MLMNTLKGLKETIRAVSGLVVVGMSLKTGSMLAEDIRNGTNYSQQNFYQQEGGGLTASFLFSAKNERRKSYGHQESHQSESR